MFHEATASKIGTGIIQCLECPFLIHRSLTLAAEAAAKYRLAVPETFESAHLAWDRLVWRRLCDFASAEVTKFTYEGSSIARVAVNLAGLVTGKAAHFEACCIAIFFLAKLYAR